jgi:hypothetical protein
LTLENTYCKVVEEDMAPLILDIEEDKEDTDHHGDNDTDNKNQTAVHPTAGSEIVRFSAVVHHRAQWQAETISLRSRTAY